MSLLILRHSVIEIRHSQAPEIGCSMMYKVLFRAVVLSVFFILSPFKLKYCQFLPNKSHKKDDSENFTLPIVKRKKSIKR